MGSRTKRPDRVNRQDGGVAAARNRAGLGSMAVRCFLRRIATRAVAGGTKMTPEEEEVLVKVMMEVAADLASDFRERAAAARAADRSTDAVEWKRGRRKSTRNQDMRLRLRQEGRPLRVDMRWSHALSFPRRMHDRDGRDRSWWSLDEPRGRFLCVFFIVVI